MAINCCVVNKITIGGLTENSLMETCCGNPLVHTPERNTRLFDKSQRNKGYNAHAYRKTCITMISIYTHTTFLPPSIKTIINNCQVKNVQVDA